MTQMRQARAGIVTEQMRTVAQAERLDAERIREEVAAGRMIIPANIHHPELQPIGIGLAAI